MFVVGEVEFDWKILLFIVFCFEIVLGEEIFCCWERNGFCGDFFVVFVELEDGVFLLDGVWWWFEIEGFLFWKLDWLLKFSCCLEGVVGFLGGDFKWVGILVGMGKGEVGVEEDWRCVFDEFWYNFGILDKGVVKR